MPLQLGSILLIACPERKSPKMCDRVIKWTSVMVAFTFFHTVTFSFFPTQQKLHSVRGFVCHHLLLKLYTLSYVLQLFVRGVQRLTVASVLLCLIFLSSSPLRAPWCLPTYPTSLFSVSLVIRLSLTS